MGRYQLEEFAPCMILLEKQQRGRRENEKGEAQWQPPIAWRPSLGGHRAAATADDRSSAVDDLSCQCLYVSAL